MSFSPAFIDRINRLMGIISPGDGEFSFFEPGGNDHFIQFLYLTLPREYLELEKTVRYQLLLVELNDQIGNSFELDGNCEFATLVQKNGKGINIARAVMDLRHQNLIAIYCLGEPKTCKTLNKLVQGSDYFRSCFISSQGLIGFAKELEKIAGVSFFFEQSFRIHLQPQSLIGSVTGDLAQKIFFEQIVKQPQRYNVQSLTGNTIDGAHGKVTFSANGGLHIDTCKLSSFFKTAEWLFNYLTQKYEHIICHKIQKWDTEELPSGVNVNISPINLKFDLPIDKMDGLLRHLTQGVPPLLCIGTSERISRVLWKVFITEISTGDQLTLEISDSMMRIYVAGDNSIPLVDKIESFVRGHISPLIAVNHEDSERR